MTVVNSELDIYNLALTRIGHEPLSSPTEQGKAGDRCRLHYPVIRDTVLMAHPWNFAVRRQELAQLSETPAFEFDYAYALPTDPYCLRVLRTEWEASGYAPFNWRVESINVDGTPVRALLCNEPSVSIEYIARITDVALFSALFVDTLAARLAAEIAISMTDNQAAAKTMMDFYAAKLAEARTMDAQEGSPRDVVNTDGWLMARV